MNILSVENVSKSYTERVLFDKITFGIDDRDKIGIIGINGTGKSTLLKIVAGLEHPDEGKLTFANNTVSGYLAQKPEFDSSMNILENVLYDQRHNNIRWELEGQAKGILNRLGINSYTNSIDQLSGGEKKRVALARTLLTQTELLVLDEPTNHLDSEMSTWLEEYLKNYKGALIMVTHDRYFLDKVTNRILEIDRGKVYAYDGGYSKFLELKAEREDIALAAERKAKSLYRTELEWMMRGARARSTKQKAHIERFEKLRDRERPEEEKRVELNSISSRMGKKTIEAKNISKSFGDRKVINDFSYIFLKDDRVGIIGHNGSGKTTLLKIITNAIQPDTGSIEIGQTIKIGYFTQENEHLNEDVKVIDYIKDTAEYVLTIDGRISASAMLEKFLFMPEIQYTKIERLSGGEKRRLYLLKILMESPNVLILDEPTNDLDIQTMTILEDYLLQFDGIVITVSHDRYFLDKTVRRIFAFEDGNIRQYEGGYSDYYEKYENDHAVLTINNYQENDTTLKNDKTTSKDTWKGSSDKKVKFTYSEQREFDNIDSVIDKIEEDIKKSEQDIALYSTDFVKLNEAVNRKQKLEEELEIQTDRWVYLNELNEQIEQNKR